ncbi:MAG TPA: hypothetical protein VIX35_03280 [Vicinamibacterales bacterium]
MDAPQATDHLDMVEHILRQVRSGSAPPLQFIVWGCVGIAFDIAGQLASMGKTGSSVFWAAGTVLAIAIVVSVWDLRRTQREAGRQSIVGRIAALSFWMAASVMTVATLMNEFTHLMPEFSPAIFYATGMSIALLSLGLALRSAPMLFGGCALVATLIAAFLVPAWLGAILAVGNFAGFIVPGIWYSSVRDDG